MNKTNRSKRSREEIDHRVPQLTTARCNSRGTETMGIPRSLATSSTITTLMSSRCVRVSHTPCQRAPTFLFATPRPRMESRRPSPSLVAPSPRRRTCAIATRRCTSRSQATCLRSMHFVPNRTRLTRSLREQRLATLLKIVTSALITM